MAAQAAILGGYDGGAPSQQANSAKRLTPKLARGSLGLFFCEA
jgi:hypothetical protein